MSGGEEKVQVALDEGAEAVVVRGGTRVEFNASGGIDVYGNVPVMLHPTANDTSATGNTAPEIGNEMEDGTILAGYYKGKPLYATPKDAPGTYTFNEAAKYAENLDAHGHRDFRAPSKGELNVLWENRDKGKLMGTFNESSSDDAGWYWSSSQDGNYFAWGQRFSDGSQGTYSEYNVTSLRCVR